jgi:hypothetical protein
MYSSLTKLLWASFGLEICLVPLKQKLEYYYSVGALKKLIHLLKMRVNTIGY